MEFRDLKRQYEHLKTSIDNAIMESVHRADFIMGKNVLELEKELAEYVESKYCISCANGTDALQLALMAWGIGKNDAVFIPDFTFFSTGEVVLMLNATPVFVDVELDTFNISVSMLEEEIKRVLKEGKLCPKVIIAVDLFGLPANYIELRNIASKYNLLILEDSAQGFGSSIERNNHKEKALSFGDISITSFFSAKPLGCYGDGGALFTNSDEVANILRSLCIHGKGENKYDNIRVGMNSRLDTIQAAILQVKLKAFREYELDDINKAASLYNGLLEKYVITPVIPEKYYSSFAQYTIRLKNHNERATLQKKLADNHIPSMIYYPKPLHMQKVFMDLGIFTNSCGNSMILSETVLSLPIHPYITEEEIMLVVDVIKSI